MRARGFPMVCGGWLAVCVLAVGCGAPPGSPDGGQEPFDGGTLRRIVALELSPAALALYVGEVAGLTVTATFDDGTQADVTGSVQWEVTPPEVAVVRTVGALEGWVEVEALRAGEATIVARTGSARSRSCALTVQEAPDGGALPKEVRAVWVTRFSYASAVPADAIRLIERTIGRAAGAGFNVVYFQVRGNGDAYYRSDLVPWARALTGTLGKDPGWDPLQVALDTARDAGVELHAYWNTHSAWPTPAGCASASGGCRCEPSRTCTLPPASPVGMPNHLLYEHPEYMAVTDGGVSEDTEYYWFSPGHPAVQAHLLAAASELLDRYPVDGLHLDRIRYPGPRYSFDAESRAQYLALPAATRPSYADWQREQVSQTVGELYAALRQRRPGAVLSAAVWGIYKPLAGCSTSQGYGDYFQDSVGWMQTQRIDALVPMMYWDIAQGCTDWAALLQGFLAGANGRPIVAGMLGLDQGVPKMERMAARIEHARTVGAAGTAIFASSYLDAKSSGSPTWPEVWPQFRQDGGVYAHDAGTPPITWR
jgi:uncharacterized lipoprotein YddW (UPF0748 family)